MQNLLTYLHYVAVRVSIESCMPCLKIIFGCIKRLKCVRLRQEYVVLNFVKSKRIKEPEMEYEKGPLLLGLKGKTGLQISSVPMEKLKALNEWNQKYHLPRRWRLSKGECRLVLE